MESFGSPTITTFRSRSDQVVHYMRRFLVWLVEIGSRAGMEFPGSDQGALISTIQTIPPAYLIGQALDVNDKLGSELDGDSLVGVAKLVSSYSSAASATSLATQMTAFVEYLEQHPDDKAKFFSYVKLFKRLLDSKN